MTTLTDSGKDAAVWIPDPRVASPAGSLWAVERLIRRRYPVLCVTLVVGVVANEIAEFGVDFARWDWLLVSGFAALVVAGYWSLWLPDQVSDAVIRLRARSVYTGAVDIDALLLRIHRRAKKGGTVASAIFIIIIAVSFSLAFGDQLGSRTILLAVEGLAAVPVGMFVGRAVIYGQLGRHMFAAGGFLVPEPRHLDGVSGLLPIGHLYFYHARLLAVPGFYLAAWWVLIPLLGDRYLYWRDIYVGLLAVIVACGFAVFLLPMLWFHWLMQATKTALRREADALSRSAAVGGSVQDSGRYQAIEAMPTWPVDARIRRRFGLSNVVLLIPVVAQVLGASESSRALLEQLGKSLTG